MTWQVEFFERSRGSSPPGDFVAGLPPKSQAKVARTIDLLEEFGPEIGPPYVKAVRGRGGLLELRITLGSDTFRLFFFRTDRRLVVVHGIRKKSQRTPPRELDTAERRMKEYLRSGQ